MVCSGFTQGFRLLCESLRARGARTLAIERYIQPATAEAAGTCGLGSRRSTSTAKAPPSSSRCPKASGVQSNRGPGDETRPRLCHSPGGRSSLHAADTDRGHVRHLLGAPLVTGELRLPALSVRDGLSDRERESSARARPTEDRAVRRLPGASRARRPRLPVDELATRREPPRPDPDRLVSVQGCRSDALDHPRRRVSRGPAGRAARGTGRKPRRDADRSHDLAARAGGGMHAPDGPGKRSQPDSRLDRASRGRRPAGIARCSADRRTRAAALPTGPATSYCPGSHSRCSSSRSTPA